MRVGQCFAFLFLLIAVRAFPQNAIEFVNESGNVVEPIAPAVDVPSESNETPIAQNPEVIPNETVVKNEGSQSEVAIPLDAEVSANEVLVPTVPREEDVATIDAEVRANVVNEDVMVAGEEEVNSPLVVDTVKAEIFEDIPAAPVDSQNLPQSVPSVPEVVANVTESSQVVAEVVANISESEIIAPSANVSQPAQPTPAEVPASSPSTPVPETTSVAPATEPTVSNLSSIIFGGKSLISEDPQPAIEVVAPAIEIPERAVLTNFPDIEVIIPLVDVSLPAISGRSLDSEPVPVSVLNVSSAVVDSVIPNVAPVAESENPVIPSIDVVVPESSTVEVAALPAISSRTVESEDAVSVSEPIPDSGPSHSPSDIESVSSTTEIPTPASTTSGVPEIETVGSLDDNSAVGSSSGIPSTEVAVEISQVSVPEVIPRALGAEASVDTSVPEPESSIPAEPVTSTIGISVSEIVIPEIAVVPDNVTEDVVVPENTVIPENPIVPESPVVPENVAVPKDVIIAVNTTEDTSRFLDSEAAAPESTFSVPEISSSVQGSDSITPSDSNVPSSTEGSLPVDTTSSGLDTVTTESPVSPQTSPIPCTKAGNFSVPTNCRLYRTCSAIGTDLTLQEYECPVGYAFSPIIRRCSRDISPCGDSEPACLRSGSIADPNTSSAYYWCAPSHLGGYHKYHVQCDTNEVYVSSISRCLPEALHLSTKGNIDSKSDRDIVKAEWKILKKEIKQQAKEDKVRQKLEQKAKAHAEKLATKHLKKQKGDTKKHDDSDEDDDDEDED